MTREFFTPSEYETKIENTDLNMIVYVIDDIHAMGFSGKRAKPDFHFRFTSVARRDEYIAEYVAKLERNVEAKAKAKAEKKAFVHNMEVGTILYDSWGYDQTNVDFYEVVRLVGKKSVVIREVASAYVGETGGPSENVVAIAGDYISDEYGTKRVNEYNRVRMNSFSTAGVWDGSPMHKTGMGWGH